MKFRCKNSILNILLITQINSIESINARFLGRLQLIKNNIIESQLFGVKMCVHTKPDNLRPVVFHLHTFFFGHRCHQCWAIFVLCSKIYGTIFVWLIVKYHHKKRWTANYFDIDWSIFHFSIRSLRRSHCWQSSCMTVSALVGVYYGDRIA